MKNAISAGQRRKFLKQSMSLVFGATAIPSFAGTWIKGKKDFYDFEKQPPLPTDMVSEFVRVAHFDLTRVKEMIEKGYLGKVTQIDCRWDRNWNWRRPVPAGWSGPQRWGTLRRRAISVHASSGQSQRPHPLGAHHHAAPAKNSRAP